MMTSRHGCCGTVCEKRRYERRASCYVPGVRSSQRYCSEPAFGGHFSRQYEYRSCFPPSIPSSGRPIYPCSYFAGPTGTCDGRIFAFSSGATATDLAERPDSGRSPRPEPRNDAAPVSGHDKKDDYVDANEDCGVFRETPRLRCPTAEGCTRDGPQMDHPSHIPQQLPVEVKASCFESGARILYSANDKRHVDEIGERKSRMRPSAGAGAGARVTPVMDKKRSQRSKSPEKKPPCRMSQKNGAARRLDGRFR